TCGRDRLTGNVVGAEAGQLRRCRGQVEVAVYDQGLLDGRLQLAEPGNDADRGDLAEGGRQEVALAGGAVDVTTGQPVALAHELQRGDPRNGVLARREDEPGTAVGAD